MSGRHRTLCALCAVTLAWTACGKAPPQVMPAVPAAPPVTIVAPPDVPIQASLTLSAASDVNPNDAGRPSPIVVRIYQLRATGAFGGADFAALDADDRKTLGAELITRDEITLLPGEQRTLSVQIAKETRFVGAIAVFQKIADAQWRASAPAPKTGLSVVVERARLIVSTTD